MQGDVGIKALNLDNLCHTIAQGSKSARSRPEEESDGLIFSYLCCEDLGMGFGLNL